MMMSAIYSEMTQKKVSLYIKQMGKLIIIRESVCSICLSSLYSSCNVSLNWKLLQNFLKYKILKVKKVKSSHATPSHSE